jgi:hypothetical protein
VASVKITDIAPGKGDVTIDEHTVEVRGLSLHTLASIVQAYPSVLAYLETGKVDQPVELLTSIPDAAIAIMAAGVDRSDDQEVIGALRGWELSQQSDLLSGVIARTMRGSAGPFVQMLLAAVARGAKVDQADASGSTSPPASPESSNA